MSPTAAAEHVSKTLILGLGNALRGDDGIGLAVLEQLKDCRFPAGTTLIDGGTGGLEITLEFVGKDRVLIVDSARFGGHPGEIRRFDLLVTPLPSACWGQGHAHGLVAAIELAQALSVLPEQLLLFAIEPTAIETPMCLSPLVEQAIPQVVSAVIAELALPIAKAPTGPVGVDTCRNLRS